MSNPTVVIDSFPESVARYTENYAVVAVDVCRATTTATTAVWYNRTVYPVQSTDEAFSLAQNLEDPLFIGELGGSVPYGFDMTNSPVQITAMATIQCGHFTDPVRPLILLSSSGTQLIKNAAGSEAVYIGCFRNFSAVAKRISERHSKVAIIGAGTRAQFRREDQIGCAWIAERLMEAGYQAESSETESIVERWRGQPPEVIRDGRSAEYLKRTGQVHDLEFIIHHIDDVDTVPLLVDGRLVRA